MTGPDMTATPWRRSPAELQAGLTAWAEALRGASATISDFRTPQSGMANDTILFRLDGEPLVARLSPAPDAPYPTFPQYDLHLQRDVIELVWTKTDVPVPEVVHLEEVDHWLGVPFIVVRQIDGVVPSDNPPFLTDADGWFLQGTPDDWKRFEESTISVLARLHTVPDDDAAALLRPAHPRYRRPAAELPARVLRLGTGGARDPADGAGVREARRHAAGQRHLGPQLGRQPRRQHHLPRLRTGRRARLGDGDRRAAARSTSRTTFFQKFNAVGRDPWSATRCPRCSTPTGPRSSTRSSGVALDDLRWCTRRSPATGSRSSCCG
ncbi:MAG: phosphotransferase [Acidimicrobiia bacterium]